MTIDDAAYLEAYPQAAPATAQPDFEELDRRSTLIRQARFEIARRKELGGQSKSR